jgi:hypothetical protein
LHCRKTTQVHACTTKRERTRGTSPCAEMSLALNTTPCLPRLVQRTISTDLPPRVRLRPRATSPTQAGLPACKQRPSNTDIPTHVKALLVTQRTSLQPRPLSLAKIGAKAPHPLPRLPSQHTPRPPCTHALPGPSHAHVDASEGRGQRGRRERGKGMVGWDARVEESQGGRPAWHGMGRDRQRTARGHSSSVATAKDTHVESRQWRYGKSGMNTLRWSPSIASPN